MSPIGKAATVLVVDDSEDIRFVLTESLMFDGYRALSARSAAEAMDLIERHPETRLVISDVRMPGGSGIELAQRLRAVAPEIRIVLMTGLAADLAGEVRADVRIIQKPIDLDVLQKLVSDLLD